MFAGLYGYTACTRRYVGVWEIAGGRLLLTRLHTLTEEDLPLDVLFPELQAPMFADWFSGTLRCPKGPLLKYVHNDFQSIYEREWHIVVKNGLVQGVRLEINPPPPRDPQEEWDIPECLKKR